ncbi:MAG: sel1 repeat family protein [Muribaculaceae bacterium]|nr:sel1 repeat family protein [Muribaculaceae bacterium]
MKRILSLLLLCVIAVSASAAGRVNRFPNRLNKGNKNTVEAAGQKADVLFSNVEKPYAAGKISSDSVVSLALYHKVWSPQLAERCLKLASGDRNLKAVRELGVLYLFSPGFASQKEEGLKLLQKAAQGGDREANGYLGYYYFTQKDYDKAKTFLEASRPMTQGIEYAALGSMYVEGKGVAEDGKKARDNYHQAALLGLPRGMSLYASLLGTKNGGPMNYPDSFFWHYLAGELGDNYSRVMLYLPRIAEPQPDSEVGKDAQLALTWIEAVHKGKNMKNEPLYKDGFLKGLKAQEQAAERGDDWARFYLGGMNYNGDFLNQNYAQALRYYEPIAKNGKLPARMLAVVHERLAKMYREGKGTVADPAKAESHTRLAARYGSLSSYKTIENISD